VLSRARIGWSRLTEVKRREGENIQTLDGPLSNLESVECRATRRTTTEMFARSDTQRGRIGPPRDLANGPVRMLVEFCRFARANGLNSGPNETIDCLEVLRSANLADSETLKFGLRAVLCSSKEEWSLFDGLFEMFWAGLKPNRVGPSTKRPSRRASGSDGQTKDNETFALTGNNADSDLNRGSDGKAASGASVVDRLRTMDFAQMPEDDLAALDRLSQRLLRRMSCRVSRRLRSRQCRGSVNLRKTIRLSIGRGGDPIELSYKRRKLQRARLVILLDVSGSMSPYSMFLLRFVYALEKQFREVDAFVFSTNLVEITDVLSTPHLSDALETLAQTSTGWSGGTKIGESLQDFNRRHARRLLSRGTVFMILSDGWDTGEPEVLAAELRTIKRRVSKLIWLNPLIGLEDYEPITRGMSAALPHIDVFAPAHNLHSLLELERHLGPRRSG
jgi:uncharacterized protein with von Willebrand factor type A (vWA) domain